MDEVRVTSNKSDTQNTEAKWENAEFRCFCSHFSVVSVPLKISKD